MKKDYYVGLDLGTNSLGWAVTDENYSLSRLKGKTAFGSRIFSEANDCKKRRNYRTNKRRLNRRKYRIYLLNQLFKEEIYKVDSNFFARLANSTYLFEDKTNLVDSNHVIFKSKEEEKKFYKTYKTIWHLRKDLMNDCPEAFDDIRKLYMALHHIIKYRGNFINEGEMNYREFNSELLLQLNEALKEIYLTNDEDNQDFEINFIGENQAENLKKILLKKESKTLKQKEIKDLFENYKYCKDYIDLFRVIVTGGKFSLKKLLPESEFEIDFSSLQANMMIMKAELKTILEISLLLLILLKSCLILCP